MTLTAQRLHQGLIWITGYSGAGKTTVARDVERRLRDLDQPVVFLDGDDLRSIFAGRWGYEQADRLELAHVYLRLCSHLAAQGHVVVLAAVAMFAEVQDWVRANIPASRIVLLDVPREIRVSRDAGTKNVYLEAHDPEHGYDVPQDPDLRLLNFGELSVEEAGQRIVEDFLRHGDEVEADRGKSRYWDAYYSAATEVGGPSPFALDVGKALPSGQRLLEVGCGNGRDTAYLSSLGHEVTALDASAAAVDLCRRVHGASTADFRAGSLSTHAPEWPARFDVLYTRFVIHAMTEVEERELWDQAREVLRPGATVRLECRSINDPLARAGEVLSPTERLAGHYRRFIVLAELHRRLTEAGFMVDESVEARGLAPHGDEDPVVIRVRAINRMSAP